MLLVNLLCLLGGLMVLFGGGAFANAKSAIHEIEGLLGIGFGLLIITLGAAAHAIVTAIEAAREPAEMDSGSGGGRDRQAAPPAESVNQTLGDWGGRRRMPEPKE